MHLDVVAMNRYLNIETCDSCTQRYYSQKKIYVEKEKNSVIHTSVIALLQNCTSVEEQIAVFDSVMCLKDEDMIDRHDLCHFLEDILNIYFPNCTVCLVGSSINGFGLRGCDVDLSFQYPTINSSQNDNVQDIELSLEDVDLGNVPSASVSTLPPKYQLHFIRRLLRLSGKFQEPLVIIPGYCPILYFNYKNLSCDLSFANRSALHGTNLMTICGKLDKRVAVLMRIINYWAKHSNLIGGCFKFKSYAIFLLLVYFLQTRYPPVLPTIKEILCKSESLNNWSYDVLKNVKNFETSKNTQNTEDLLRDFFFFYANFDFSWVICPLNGNLSDRSSLVSSQESTIEKFELSTIVVQDPLNLSWNVTFGVNWKNCKNFLKEILSVCELYQQSDIWLPQSSNWGLASLINSHLCHAFMRNKGPVTFEIPMKTEALETGNLRENVLLKNAAHYVLQVLDYALLFQCTKLNVENVPYDMNATLIQERNCLQNFETSEIKDVSSSCTWNSVPLKFICHVNNTWLGRNSWYGEYHNSISTKNLLDVERDISIKISQQRVKNIEKFSFTCEFSGIKKDCKFYLLVTLKSLHNDGFIPKLAIFMAEYIPKTVIHLLYNTPKSIKS